MPLYMNAALVNTISPPLKKRMQGKSCFNFKTIQEGAILSELESLTAKAAEHWAKQNWL